MATQATVPVLVRDPRFGAGRALVGQRTAVDVFAALLQDAVRTYGTDSRRLIETAPAYYEYGNALLRYALRQQEAAEETEEATFDAEQKPAAVDVRAAAAAAAERRAQQAAPPKDSSTTNAPPNVGSVAHDAANGTIVPSEEDAPTNAEEDEDDLPLALEMMETAWAILDDAASESAVLYRDWIVEQVPRVLTGLGDCLSALQRHADAVDAYLRALEHRQSMLDQCLEGVPTGDAPHLATNDIEKQLQLLKYRRQVVDVTILLVEELLACGNDADVVTTESQVVLVAKGHVIDYARGYYDRARDALQETVLLLGQVAAVTASHAALQSILQEEKENICFVATLVMGAGTTLAELDEAAAATEEKEPSQKKKKPKL